MTKAPAKYDYSKQVGHMLRKAYQRATAIFQQRCVDPQLTSAQFAVLCVLSDFGPFSQNQLGRIAGMDPATAKGVIQRLGKRGLITFAADEHDRRKVIVHLAEPGRRLVATMGPVGFGITDEILKPLNEVERVALYYLLQKISDFDETAAPAGRPAID